MLPNRSWTETDKGPSSAVCNLPDNFIQLLTRTNKKLQMTRDDILRVNKIFKFCPNFESDHDWELLKPVYQKTNLDYKTEIDTGFP